MKQHKQLHVDLFAAQKIAYEQLGFHYDTIIESAESHEYGACTFTMNNKNTHSSNKVWLWVSMVFKSDFMMASAIAKPTARKTICRVR